MRNSVKCLAPAEAVDKDRSILRGYVVAQAGPFKSQGRGEFDRESLETIIELGNDSDTGLKSRLGHPTMSDDGVGKFLGRSRDFRMSKAVDARTGKKVDAARADLHFDKTAKSTPHGNLADYVMDLAKSDAGAISSSLVLEVEETLRLEKDGTRAVGDDGEPLPPLWRPTALHASDIVDTGDAVDALLSPSELCQALDIGLTAELEKLLRFDNVARLSTQLLDGMFKNDNRGDIERRCLAWLKRYLELRFGEEVPQLSTPELDKRAARLARLATVA